MRLALSFHDWFHVQITKKLTGTYHNKQKKDKEVCPIMSLLVSYPNTEKIDKEACLVTSPWVSNSNEKSDKEAC